MLIFVGKTSSAAALSANKKLGSSPLPPKKLTPASPLSTSAKVRKIRPRPHQPRGQSRPRFSEVNNGLLCNSSVPSVSAVRSEVKARQEPVTVELDTESRRKMDEYGRKLLELRTVGCQELTEFQLDEAIRDLERRRADVLTRAFYQQRCK